MGSARHESSLNPFFSETALIWPHPRYRSNLPTPEYPPDYGEPAHLAKLGRRRWAKLLWRVYEVDALACQCGGRFGIISVIRHDPVVPKILAHLGLATELPKTAPARASPTPSPERILDPCIDPPAWEGQVYDPQTGALVGA